MTIAIVDTTVIIHLYRRYQPAIDWYQNRSEPLSITATTWMEIMGGVKSKAMQTSCKTLLQQFNLLYPSLTEQQWAMLQLEAFQFSHHIGINDCLIASVAYRLNVPLYTHNLKDMSPLIGDLAQKPYL
jgi:predicted nucleic acid-binding protein